MASLGKLWFELGLKDRTDKDIEEIRKGVEKRLKSLNVDIGLNSTALRNSIENALRGQQFKIDVVVDKANTTKLIQDAIAKAGINTNVTASDVRAKRIEEINNRINNSNEKQRLQIQKLQEQLRKLRGEYTSTSSAGKRYGDSLGGITKNMRTQFNLAVQLRNQLANIYSVYAAERFLTSIIEIGGEFQKQRVALQTMFQDAQKADALFGQIKELAVESPFEFKELAGYTKQLAAFNIPYEEMYDTTKRLADISAGVGVDMGRIILAYGQVRSAEFLKGTELRQFTEAGIPLLQQLADKFTELEGRVVSVGEVFDRISKREVSFQMVKDVLWDLTNEGGQFYNMQGALADTLAGKLSNLRDAYDVMLADIAESNNSTLSSGLDMITDTMNHWESLSRYILSAVAAYGAYKTALFLLNTATKVWLGLNQIQTIINTTRALQGLTQVTKAQALAQGTLNALTTAFNANPLVAVSTAIAGLVGAFFLFSDKAKSTQEIITGMNESLGTLQKNFEEVSGIDKLIDEYEKLSNNQNRTAQESERLETVTSSLRSHFRGAAMEVDAYSGSLQLSVNKMRELNAEQRRNYEISAQSSLKEAEDRQKDLEDKIAFLNKQIKAGGGRIHIGESTNMEDWFSVGYVTDKDVSDMANQVIQYEDELKKLRESTQNTKEFLKSLGSVSDETNLEQTLTGWRKAINDFIAGNDNLKNLVPKEAEEYQDWLKRLKGDLSEAKEELARKEGTQGLFPQSDIDAAKKRVQELQAIVDKFNISIDGGKRKNGISKDWSEILRKQLDLLRDVRVKAEMELEQSVVDTMSDGAEKELAQLKLNHKRRLSEIAKQTQELINKSREAEKAEWMKENPERKESDFTSKIVGVNDLPSEFQQTIQELVNTENELYKKSIQDYFDSVAKEFQGYLEKRKSIEEEFARKRSVLIQSGASADTIEESKYQENKALQQLDMEIAQRERTFQSWVNSISDMGLDQLRRMLIEAQAELTRLEIAEPANATELAKYRAMLIEIRKEIDKIQGGKGKGKTDSGAKEWDDLYKVLTKVNDSFVEIGDTVGGTVGEIIKQAGSLTTSFLQMVNAIKGVNAAVSSLEKASVILTAISAGMQLITGIFSIFNRTDYMKEFRKEANQLNEELRNLKANARIDSGAYDTIFGDDVWKNAINNIYAANEALADYNKTLDDIQNRKYYSSFDSENGLWGDRDMDWGYIKDMKKDFEDASDSIANMQLQIRNSTWFRKAKYTSLKDAVPELFNEDDSVNMDALEEFINSDMFSKLSQQDKEYLQEMSNNWKLYQDTIASVNDYLTDVFGNLGNTMMDALVDAFENGTDAAQAFTDSVSDMLERLASNMIYSVTLGQLFEQAQKDMLAIMGDETKTDEEKFDGYTAVLDGLINDALIQQGVATNLMEKYKEMAAEKGLDIYTPNDNVSSSVGSTIQASEETMQLTNSYLNAIRQDVSVIRNIIESTGTSHLPTISITAQAQLQQLNMIAENTRRNADAAAAIQSFLQNDFAGVITTTSGGKALRVK